MKQLTVMLKPASSLCNLRCKYCFYADVADLRQIHSFGIMTEDTMHAILTHIFTCLDAADHITFAFQGGEPLLAGMAFYNTFTSTVLKIKKGVRVHYAIQTNGTLIDDAWADFFRKHHFLVGISLDIMKSEHDRCRVDANGCGTFTKVVSAYRLLKEKGIACNILCVLTNALARHPIQVWDFLKKEGVSHVQFIPCLPPLYGNSPDALTPQRFADFYCKLFSLWLADWEKGHYISVKLFDDVIHFLRNGIPSFCGMTGQCYPQIVVEADGSAYPCDFYVLEPYRLGNLVQDTLDTMYKSEKMLAFRNRQHQNPQLCTGCTYRSICHGGCKRMQGSMYCEEKSRVCGYQLFLDACGNKLFALATQL